MIVGRQHVAPRPNCPRCPADWAAVQPQTVGTLLRSLWLQDAWVDDQRRHIRHLWADPDYRSLLEPLAAQLREQGLL